MALALSVASEGLAQTSAIPPEDVPIIELRLASPDAVAGFVEKTGIDEHGREYRVFVAPEVLASDSDFLRARAWMTSIGLAVDVELSPEAAERVRVATGNAVGQHAAVLANGQLAGFAVIMGSVPTRTNELKIGLTLPAEARADVGKRIGERWPARDP